MRDQEIIFRNNSGELTCPVGFDGELIQTKSSESNSGQSGQVSGSSETGITFAPATNAPTA